MACGQFRPGNMGRTPLLFLVVFLLAVAPAGATAQDRLPLRASLASCTAGPKGKDRVAVFTASMPALAGTSQMRMRFDLEERTSRDGANGRWKRVVAPRFTGWVRSKSRGASGFVYTKRIERLQQAAGYRAVVRFRWYDAAGRLQKTAKRRTSECEQPDQRANLRITSIRQEPAERGGGVRYSVTVVNEGLSPAGPFWVEFRQPFRRSTDIAGLSPGDSTTIEIYDDACGDNQRVEAFVDAKDDVDEADESDNRYLELCLTRGS